MDRWKVASNSGSPLFLGVMLVSPAAAAEMDKARDRTRFLIKNCTPFLLQDCRFVTESSITRRAWERSPGKGKAAVQKDSGRGTSERKIVRMPKAVCGKGAGGGRNGREGRKQAENLCRQPKTANFLTKKGIRVTQRCFGAAPRIRRACF